MSTLQIKDSFGLNFNSVFVKQCFDALPESERQDVINHVTDNCTGKEIFNSLKLNQMIEVYALIKQSKLMNECTKDY